MHGFCAKSQKAKTALASFFFAISSTDLFALNCNEVNQITQHFFRNHLTQHVFNDRFSEIVLNNYLSYLDPGKMYFLQEDVDQFQKKFTPRIASSIANNNCQIIEEIGGIYLKRFNDFNDIAKKFINSNLQFNTEDFIELDRKKISFAKSENELNDRWRIKIKYQFLMLAEHEKDEKIIREKLNKQHDLLKTQENSKTIDDLYSQFLESFAQSMDPHTNYFSPKQLQEYRIYTKLSLEGIGAGFINEDGYTIISNIVPGGAVEASGKIKVNDKIIAIGQGDESPVNIIDKNIQDVVKLIRGPRGTEVKLTIMRTDNLGTTKFVVPLKREVVKLKDREARSKIYETHLFDNPKTKYKVGVITLPSFYLDVEAQNTAQKNYKSSAKDLQRELLNLKKSNIDSIIIDLRNNSGGSLNEAIKIAGMFLQSGPVVQIKGISDTAGVLEDENESIDYPGPLVILVNRFSASASEILAGAIKDHDRGIIVGDSHTFGKGTVQNLIELSSSLGAIKVTVSSYFRPLGESTQINGVDSEIVVPSATEFLNIGEKFYPNALPWKKIDPIKFETFNLTHHFSQDLAQKSKARIEANPDFKAVLETMKSQQDISLTPSRVSLNIHGKSTSPLVSKIQQMNPKSESISTNIEQDLQLKEAIYIAADYIDLIKKSKTLDRNLKMNKQLSTPFRN